jgi:predicted RNase H-like nuclease
MAHQNADRHRAKRDDVLDACAVAIAAREPAGSVGSPPLDAHGLPMQIWF